jgi:hypothetical protein
MNKAKVEESPELMGLIKSYLPKNTKAEIEKFQEDYANSIQYWFDIIAIYDQEDMINYSSNQVKIKVQKKLKMVKRLLNVVGRILELRIEYLAKKSGVKLNEDLYYTASDDITFNDYYIVGVGNNFKVKKDALDELDDLLSIIVKKYFSLLKDLGVKKKEAYEVFNNSKVAKENNIKLPEPEEVDLSNVTVEPLDEAIPDESTRTAEITGKKNITIKKKSGKVSVRKIDYKGALYYKSSNKNEDGSYTIYNSLTNDELGEIDDKNNVEWFDDKDEDFDELIKVADENVALADDTDKIRKLRGLIFQLNRAYEENYMNKKQETKFKKTVKNFNEKVKSKRI